MRGAVATAIGALVMLGGCGGGGGGGGAGAPVDPAAPGGPPTARPAPATDEEAAAAVARALNAFRPAVHRCWARAAADDFRLGGKVTVAVTIGEDGATGKVAIADDATGDPVLGACLTEVWMQATWPPAFAAGDVVQVPIVFVAPEGQHLVASADVPVHRFGAGSGAQVVLDERSTGNPAASLSLVRFGASTEVALHRHGSAEVLYVLAGGGELVEPGKAAPRPLAPGDAIYLAPGVVHGLRTAPSADEGDPGVPLEVLIAYGPAGPEQALEGGEATGITVLTPREAARPARRGARPKVARTRDVPPIALAGGAGEVRILFDQAATGDATFALDALTAGPGMTIPPHVHDGSSEYLYLLEGRGTMTIAGAELDVSAGDAIQIPAGVEHGLVVGAGGAIKAIQLYTPAGPEQRFRKAPEVTTP